MRKTDPTIAHSRISQAKAYNGWKGLITPKWLPKNIKCDI